MTGKKKALVSIGYLLVGAVFGAASANRLNGVITGEQYVGAIICVFILLLLTSVYFD